MRRDTVQIVHMPGENAGGEQANKRRGERTSRHTKTLFSSIVASVICR